ncbi:stress responsive protein [Planctomycetaceae bacterium SCGC AG-212-F19]|nr:stress responsive protein [Planctomycetaceae bacterium SCGC AG-212-F19]
MLVHDVYFTLKDNSPAARQVLIAACRKYLSQHPGTVSFACGTLAEELNREVNDRGFDVALHIAFEDQAAHDRYQEAPLHTQFIEENRDNWAKVRVFDSTCARP